MRLSYWGHSQGLVPEVFDASEIESTLSFGGVEVGLTLAESQVDRRRYAHPVRDA